jgi:lipoprotein-releasing system permease protein
MLSLAIRHLVARKRQTLLTLLGILFGSMAYVVISGFFLGFQVFLIEQLVNNDAHIHISSREEILTEHSLDKDFYGTEPTHVFWASPPSGRKDNARIQNPPDWYKRLDGDSRVAAYSPQLVTQVVLRQSKSSIAASLYGCDPYKQVKVANIEDSMQEGKFQDLASGGNRLVVGVGLLEKLGTRVSQVVQISSGSGPAVPFKIVGSFKTGVKPIDDFRAFGALSDVQKVNGTPSEVNEIVVRLRDFSHAAEIATTWATITGDKVQSWDQINANFFSIFKIQNTMRYLMIAVILVVAGFGIYNVLNMTVTQKRKEIAILRSMGFETSDIIFLFFSQGLILGFLGGLIGLVIGYWICLYLQTVPFGGGPLGGAGYLQISIKPAIYLQAMGLAVFSASLASILPARAAGKMTPIEIIRSGTD